MSKNSRLTHLCVFCGSRSGNSPDYIEMAIELGQEIAKQNLTLVYGGASVGLMGKIADTVLENNGKVIGVIPQHIMNFEVAHEGLTELIVVKDMAERKAKMAEISQAFLSIPGGMGTLDEFSEMFTWFQLGLHKKPSGILNLNGFYDDFLKFLKGIADKGFMAPAHLDYLQVGSEVGEILDKLNKNA